jgi:hypothetical protein
LRALFLVSAAAIQTYVITDGCCLTATSAGKHSAKKSLHFMIVR